MSDPQPLFVELFSGTGRLSAAFRRRGWATFRVDADPLHEPDCRGDVRQLGFFITQRPVVVHAAPPCAEFTRHALPWFKDPPAPDMSMVWASIHLIEQLRPVSWSIENTRGAVSFLSPILGPCRSYHCVRLWGTVPPFDVVLRPWKQRLSSTSKAARSAYPLAFCEAYAQACDDAWRLWWHRDFDLGERVNARSWVADGRPQRRKRRAALSVV